MAGPHEVTWASEAVMVVLEIVGAVEMELDRNKAQVEALEPLGSVVSAELADSLDPDHLTRTNSHPSPFLYAWSIKQCLFK